MSDVWEDAASWTAVQLAAEGSVPVDPDSDGLFRYITATRAAQTFAKGYRQSGEPLGEADARRLAHGLLEGYRNGAELRPHGSPTDAAGIFQEAIRRALDPRHKDSFHCRQILNAWVDDRQREGRSLEPELRLWPTVRDMNPGYKRAFPNRLRDAWIVHTVEVLEGCGIRPTRNDAFGNELDPPGAPRTGCAIVGGELGITYRAAAGVWRDRARVR